MAIPLSYIARNLAARRLTTILTAGGMALVELMLNAAIGSLLFIAALYLISPSTVRDLWTMRKFLRVRN